MNVDTCITECVLLTTTCLHSVFILNVVGLSKYIFAVCCLVNIHELFVPLRLVLAVVMEYEFFLLVGMQVIVLLEQFASLMAVQCYFIMKTC